MCWLEPPSPSILPIATCPLAPSCAHRVLATCFLASNRRKRGEIPAMAGPVSCNDPRLRTSPE